MNENEFSAPPISGEELPSFRELDTEPSPTAKKAKTETLLTQPPSSNKKAKIIIIVLSGALILVLILLLVALVGLLRPKKTVQSTPTPTPVTTVSPEASPSGLPQSVKQRREDLEKQVTELDLQETDLAFPTLDFDIKF